MPEKSKLSSAGQISVIHLVIALIIGSLMILGLTNSNPIFRVALFGPIIIYCISAFFYATFTEWKHHFSITIDSFLSTKLNLQLTDKGHIHSWRFVTAGIISISIILALISVLIMGKLNFNSWLFGSTSWFGLIAASSSIFLGIGLGRILSPVNYHSFFTETNIWNQGGHHLEKNREYNVFRKWLMTSESDILGGSHAEDAASQKLKFLRFIRNNIGDSLVRENIIRIINSGDIDTELLIYFKSMEVVDTWFFDIERFFIDDRIQKGKSSFYAFILLPVVAELLRDLIHDFKVSDHSIEKIINQLSGYLRELHYLEMYLPPGVSTSAVHQINQPTELINFIRRFSLARGVDSNFDWEPWWIISVRVRMETLQYSNEWKKLTESTPYDDRNGVDEAFSSIAKTISKFSIHKSDHSNLNWETMLDSLVENIESQDSTESRDLFSSLHRHVPSTGILVNDIILIAWTLFQTIILRERDSDSEVKSPKIKP